MQCRSTAKSREISDGGVTISDNYSYPYKLIVTFSISVITTGLWRSNYSNYQKYLFRRISCYKEEYLTPIGYRRISQILNSEGLQEVGVIYDEKIKSHLLDIFFRYPSVGDVFQYDISGEKDDKGFKKYNITDGITNKLLEVPLVNYRKKQNEKTRDKLNSIIIELKEEKGYSLQEICNELNGLNLRTPTKKKWDKPKLSSYYKNLKEKVPKK